MASFCTSCGQGFSGSERFCGNCGAPAAVGAAPTAQPTASRAGTLPPLTVPGTTKLEVEVSDDPDVRIGWRAIGGAALGGLVGGALFDLDARIPESPNYLEPEFVVVLGLVGALVGAGSAIGGSKGARALAPVDLLKEVGAVAAAFAVAAAVGELLMENIFNGETFTGEPANVLLIWVAAIGLAQVLLAVTGQRPRYAIVRSLLFGIALGSLVGGAHWLGLDYLASERVFTVAVLAIAGASVAAASAMGERNYRKAADRAELARAPTGLPVHRGEAVPYGAVYAVAPRNNGLAVAGFVLGLLGFWVLGVIFSGVALGQIDRSGGLQTGRGLAIAGLVISLVWMLLTVAVFALLFGAA